MFDRTGQSNVAADREGTSYLVRESVSVTGGSIDVVVKLKVCTTGAGVNVETTVTGGKTEVVVTLMVNVTLEVWICTSVAVVICNWLVVVVTKLGG